MNTYMLVRQKETNRIALLNGADFNSQEWVDLDVRYIADSWLDAREQMYTGGMYHIEGHGWFNHD